MNSNNQTSAAHDIIAINWADRWQVYHRLQSLQIPCQCKTNKPLRVQFDTAIAAIQLWSVAKQFTAPRYELVSWLNRCWQLTSYDPE